MDAILAVYFGTTYKDQRIRSISSMTEDIKKNFHDCKIYTAFSSGFIIKKLQNVDPDILSISKAMEKIRSDGIKNVFVQPVIFIKGEEYEYILNSSMKYKNSFDSIKIGEPLLSSEDDYSLVSSALKEIFSQRLLENIIFMGHGTEHPANSSYMRLYSEMQSCGMKNSFIGLAESKPDINDIIEFLKNKNSKDVLLTPFMLVAGDHARNDMSGENGWEKVLSSLGYNVSVLLKGMGEYPQIRSIFIKHIKALKGES